MLPVADIALEQAFCQGGILGTFEGKCGITDLTGSQGDMIEHVLDGQHHGLKHQRADVGQRPGFGEQQAHFAVMHCMTGRDDRDAQADETFEQLKHLPDGHAVHGGEAEHAVHIHHQAVTDKQTQRGFAGHRQRIERQLPERRKAHRLQRILKLCFAQTAQTQPLRNIRAHAADLLSDLPDVVDWQGEILRLHGFAMFPWMGRSIVNK